MNPMPKPRPVIREGFKPKYKQLDDDSMKLLLYSVLADQGQGKVDPAALDDLPFPAAVVRKRVEVLKLPIEFTTAAYLSICSFAKTPGASVVLLIDALTQFEGQMVTAGMLCDLYPEGFYDEPSLMILIDTYMKTKQTKWSELY